jgi:hypothetical protein
VTKVLDNAARARLVENLAGHLGNVKKAEIKANQRAFSFIPSKDPPPLSLSFRVPHHKESGERPSPDTPLVSTSGHLCDGEPAVRRCRRQGYRPSIREAPPGQTRF